MMGWQLDHMQIICTSFQTDNHASTSKLSIFTGRMPFLPANQQCQSTEGEIKQFCAVVTAWIVEPCVISHLTATSVKWNHCRQLSSLVRGQLLTMWNTPRRLSHGHPSVVARTKFLQQDDMQWPTLVQKWFTCVQWCRGSSNPGCWI